MLKTHATLHRINTSKLDRPIAKEQVALTLATVVKSMVDEMVAPLKERHKSLGLNYRFDYVKGWREVFVDETSALFEVEVSLVAGVIDQCDAAKHGELHWCDDSRIIGIWGFREKPITLSAIGQSEQFKGYWQPTAA
jgi:hypothetical protein